MGRCDGEGRTGHAPSWYINVQNELIGIRTMNNHESLLSTPTAVVLLVHGSSARNLHLTIVLETELPLSHSTLTHILTIPAQLLLLVQNGRRPFPSRFKMLDAWTIHFGKNHIITQLTDLSTVYVLKTSLHKQESYRMIRHENREMTSFSRTRFMTSSDALWTFVQIRLNTTD